MGSEVAPSFPPAPHELGFEGELVVAFAPPAAGAPATAWPEAVEAACGANAARLSPLRGHRVEVAFAIPVPDKEPRDYRATTEALVPGILTTDVVVPRRDEPWLMIESPWFGVMVRPEVSLRFRCAAPLAVDLPF